jgi:transcriptional regulator with XRE-family HTH domain
MDGTVIVRGKERGAAMALLRRVLGETLRGRRLRQRRTLREVSAAARVSLGYLSEVERGQKEASSELLASICGALDVPLSEVLEEASVSMREVETPARTEEPVLATGGELPPLEKVVIGPPSRDQHDGRVTVAA